MTMRSDRPTPPGVPPRRRFRLALAVPSALLFLYLAVGLFVTVTLTRPHRNLSPVSPASLKLSFESVRFPARSDGTSIAAWYLPSPNARRAVVMVHGKDSSRFRQYGGRGPEVAASLLARDLTVLMIDLRGHGESGDGRFTFGIRESRDVLGAVDYLLARGMQPGSIGLLGASMGAATSIYAAAAEPRIGAIVEDCGYADIAPIIASQWRQTTGLPNIFVPATRLWSRLLVGVDIESAKPVQVIGQIAPRPLLIIHSADDELVPVENAHQLQRALPSAELWIVPGAGHVAGYRVDPAGYTKRVGDFFDRHLPR